MQTPKFPIQFCGIHLALAGILLALGAGLLPLSAEDPHSAINPVPRTGGVYQRHLKFNEKVQGNQGNVELIFVGDSITQGWEGAGRKVWEAYYTDRKALNLGIGGDRTQHVLWRLDHGNLDGIQPKVAVVMIGTNNSGRDRNSASEIVDGIIAVVEKLQAKVPGIKILLLDIFPRGQNFNDQRGKILQVNQTVRKLHDGQKVHYLPIGHHFLESDGTISKTIMPDFLHLSPAGYEIWAAQIEPKLASLLGDEPKTAKSSRLAGNWTWSMAGPEGRMVDALMVFNVQGNDLAGRFEMNEDRRLKIEQGKVNGDAFSFFIRRDRPNGGVMVYEMKGKLDGEMIQGTASTSFNGEDRTQEWTAKRR